MNFMSYNEKNGNYAFLDQLMTKEVEMNKVCLKKKTLLALAVFCLRTGVG